VGAEEGGYSALVGVLGLARWRTISARCCSARGRPLALLPWRWGAARRVRGGKRVRQGGGAGSVYRGSGGDRPRGGAQRDGPPRACTPYVLYSTGLLLRYNAVVAVPAVSLPIFTLSCFPSRALCRWCRLRRVALYRRFRIPYHSSSFPYFLSALDPEIMVTAHACVAVLHFFSAQRCAGQSTGAQKTKARRVWHL